MEAKRENPQYRAIRYDIKRKRFLKEGEDFKE